MEGIILEAGTPEALRDSQQGQGFAIPAPRDIEEGEVIVSAELLRDLAIRMNELLALRASFELLTEYTKRQIELKDQQIESEKRQTQLEIDKRELAEEKAEMLQRQIDRLTEIIKRGKRNWYCLWLFC